MDVTTSMALTLRGRILALLISLAVLATWLTGEHYARLAASLLMAPMLIDLLCKGRRLGSLELRAGFRRTQAGLPYLESIEVRGGKRTVHDLALVEPRTATFAGGALLETLQPGNRTTVRLAARSRRRGYQPSRTFILETRYPFGFLCSRAEFRLDAELITEPARMELPQSLLQAMQRGELEPCAHVQPGGGEFHSLREYVPGEDARTVHALRSATMGTLVRKDLRGHQQREAWMVLDLRRPPGRVVHPGGRRLEWSLSACASLLDLLTERGVLLRCLAIEQRDRYWTVDTHRSALDLLTFLAEAQPVPHRALDRDFPEELLRGEVYWFPAGGYLARRERKALHREVTLVGVEP